MDLSRLDQERHALELSLSKLKADLRRWQTWEAEYEGLKEEIDANTPELDVTALTHISKTYNGEQSMKRRFAISPVSAKGNRILLRRYRDTFRDGKNTCRRTLRRHSADSGMPRTN
jgi:hypothetical protein